MVRVEHVLDSWKNIREDTIAAVREFPENEGDFRAAPEMATFCDVARHILDSSDCLIEMLLDGMEDFTTPEFRERLARHASPLPPKPSMEDIAKALTHSMQRRSAELAARSPEFFAGMVTRFDGQRLTRLEMIQTIKEHELTHRAQLFVCLRLKGCVPVTTRRRLARQAAK